MTKQQLSAIRKFRLALAELQSAGLHITSVDDSMVVFDFAAFKAISNGRSPSECLHELDGDLIEGFNDPNLKPFVF
jgi:hypothetical protein